MLRIQDFTYLDDRMIVVRGSATDEGIGPLKQDRRGQGKSKMAPAHSDTERMPGPWLELRRAEDARRDDVVLVPVEASDRPRTTGWPGIRKGYVQSCWEKARVGCGVGAMTFYEATRHSKGDDAGATPSKRCQGDARRCSVLQCLRTDSDRGDQPPRSDSTDCNV
jgi:hypothetical protein